MKSNSFTNNKIIESRVKLSLGLPVTKFDFLDDTIISCLEQTETNFELVIINNGGKDGVKCRISSIIEKYLPDPRIRYFVNEEQLNISDNFNKLVKLSKGEYLNIISDDDLMMPNFVEEFILLANKFPNIPILHCRSYIINGQGEIIDITPICPEYEEFYDFLFHRLKRYRLQFLSDFVFKREILIERGWFPKLPSGWGIDDLAWFRLANPDGIAFTYKTLFKYRMHSGNYTNSNVDYFESRLKDIEYYYNDISKYLNTLENNIYPFKIIHAAFIEAKINAHAFLLFQYLSAKQILKGLVIYFKYKDTYQIKVKSIIIAIQYKLKQLVNN